MVSSPALALSRHCPGELCGSPWSSQGRKARDESLRWPDNLNQVFSGPGAEPALTRGRLLTTRVFPGSEGRVEQPGLAR